MSTCRPQVQPYLYVSQQKSWAGWEKNLTAIFYAPFSLPDHIFEHSGYRCSQKLLSKMAVAYCCYVSSSKKRFFQSLLLATAAAKASSLLTPGGSMALAHPFLCEHDTTCTGASWGQGCVEILQKDSYSNIRKVELL